MKTCMCPTTIYTTWPGLTTPTRGYQWHSKHNSKYRTQGGKLKLVCVQQQNITAGLNWQQLPVTISDTVNTTANIGHKEEN